MLSANANTVQALRSGDRVFTYSVIVNGTTDITDKTLSAQITETGSSAQRLSIGEFCRSQCTLSVLENAIADWYHAYFTVSVTINNESIPLGKYYVPEVDIRNNPGTVTVTGYDSSWLWEDEFIYTDTSALAIVSAIETYTGQSIVNKSLLTDFTIPIISDSDNPLTYRDVMGYIAGLQGYNIRPTRDGDFELYKYFGGTPYVITHADIFENGLSYELTPTEITSYEISNETEMFTQGTGYGVVYYNPFITGEIAEDIDDYPLFLFGRLIFIKQILFFIERFFFGFRCTWHGSAWTDDPWHVGCIRYQRSDHGDGHHAGWRSRHGNPCLLRIQFH